MIWKHITCYIKKVCTCKKGRQLINREPLSNQSQMSNSSNQWVMYKLTPINIDIKVANKQNTP